MGWRIDFKGLHNKGELPTRQFQYHFVCSRKMIFNEYFSFFNEYFEIFRIFWFLVLKQPVLELHCDIMV